MSPLRFTAPALRCLLAGILATALASGCGFRPRGSASLPDDFRHVYVEAPVDIADELAVFLESGGAEIAKSRADADAVINVQSESFQDRVVAVDATTGKAREFELLFTLDFSVRMKDGAMLVSPERVAVRRNYVFDQNAVIGSLDNVAALRVDMRRDAAERIIRRTEAALRR
jgi:LPS-assembly lipoprotein